MVTAQAAVGAPDEVSEHDAIPARSSVETDGEPLVGMTQLRSVNLSPTFQVKNA